MRSPPQRVLVVANPISGRGRGQVAAEELVRGFRRHGVAVELALTRARGDAPGRMAAADAADLVVAVGGDGTLSEVLMGLADPRTPVGLLPCGTANVLARALGLPRDPDQALATFLAGRIQELDVARVAGRFAHLVVGVGFDGRVVRELEARRRGPITKRTYVGAVLRALAHDRPRPLRVWLDERELREPVSMLWATNTTKYADLLRLAEDARLDDGWWEVYLFPSANTRELLAAAARGLWSRLPGGAIRMQRARRLRVEASDPVPIQIDGDFAGETPLEFELLDEKFRIVVPA